MAKPGLLATLTTPKIKRAEVGGRDDTLWDAAQTAVYNDEATTITVKHTINTGVAEPPLILGANNQNQKVVGLDADRLDGEEGSAFHAWANLTGRAALIDAIQTLAALGSRREVLRVNEAANALEFGFPGFFGCLLNLGVSQSIPNSTLTDVLWDIEIQDDDGWHNPVNGRITPTRGGLYLAVGNARWAGDVDGYRQGDLNKNGAGYASLYRFVGGFTASDHVDLPFAQMVEMNGTTDYITKVTIHNAGAALDLQAGSRFGLIYLGKTG